MNFLSKIFSSKSTSQALVVKEDNETEIAVREPASADVTNARYQQILSMMEGIVHPLTVGNNFLEMFKTIPEVFWPIDYIAKRISEAHFDLKRVKDDSIVWCNRQNIDRILKEPNPVMTFREVLYQHFVYKLCTGNAFLRAAMPESLTEDALKCVFCSHYWELPAPLVQVLPMEYSYGVPLFGIADKDELIKGYKLNLSPYNGYIIPRHQIWHDRDGLPEFLKSDNFLKSESRLKALKRPIANLLAVYEARNVIYLKRGGLGFIVARKQDETGTIALDPDEKKQLTEDFAKNYGVTDGKSPYIITDIPVDFIKTNLSISELQPFEETLEDAVKIAGAFNIPAVLVPRKDQSTFSNQDSAEQSVYYATIIPMAKRFCEALTTFLGLEQKGYYLDCDFSEVACLQKGKKDEEEVKDKKFARGLAMFNAGLCTLDDIRANMHESSKADTIPLFSKLKFEMSPEELEIVNKLVITQLTSKGESNGQKDNKSGSGNDEEPTVRNQGS